MRFHFAVFIYITALICFLVFIYGIGSPIPELGRNAFLGLFASVWMSAFGVRRVQGLERSQFLRAVREKRKAQNLVSKDQELRSRRLERDRNLEQLRRNMMKAVDNEDADGIEEAMRSLQAGSSLMSEQLVEMEREMRSQLSCDRGVLVSYLLSEEFQSLAQNASNSEDPTFYELSSAFFLSAHAIGRGCLCPRDGLQGCSYVDTLPCHHRGSCTHFLSWT